MRRIDFLNRFGSMRAVSAVASSLAPIVDCRLVPYPYLMTWVVTRRCNSRCQMCTIWQNQDPPFLTTTDAEHALSRDDFSFVRSLTLTGGEPTLRSDLPQLFEIALRHCPNLEHVLLATNGLNPSRVAEHAGGMLDILVDRENRVYRFDVQISLDGVGKVHDTVRGVKGSYGQVQATIALLRKLQASFPHLNIRLSSVLLPYNLSNADALQAFAREENLHISYSPALIEGGYYGNLDRSRALSFPVHGDSSEARQFFEQLGREDETSLRFYYQDMAQMVQGKPRGRRCMMGFYGFVLEHDGRVYPCVNCEKTSFGNLLTDSFEALWFGARADTVRRELRASCCPTCTSACYPLPANALELAESVWRTRIRPVRSRKPQCEVRR